MRLQSTTGKMNMFRKRGASGEMFELSEEEQLEEIAIELTEKHLNGKRVDIANRAIHWSIDSVLDVTQCAEHLHRLVKSDEPINIAMIERAILGWLELGEFYPDDLSVQQQSDLDDQVWQWIEDYDESQ